MEGTRHPHQAMQPVSPWQQQQYQQSGQQYQQPRSGQPFQQPRLGQQYQQPRFQSQYQQSEFRQQHNQSGLDQHYQQSELVPLHQELGLAQFHQHTGFGQQHQQSRLTQPRLNEPFPPMYQQLPKQQSSQHSYDDKQHDYQSHPISVSGQQQSPSPSPQQQKEAHLMSLLKELQENKNSQIQMHPSLDMHHDDEITPPASLSTEISAFSQNTRKEREPNEELESQLGQRETAMSVRVGLHCAPSVNQTSTEGVNPTKNTGIATVKAPMEKNVTHLSSPPSDLSSKPLCSKTPHVPRSSHDLPQYDFTNITRINRGIANLLEGRHGHVVSDDRSSSVEQLETALNNSNPPVDRSETAFRNNANPSDDQLNSVLGDDSNSCGNPINTVDGDDSSSLDGQLSSALHDDSNPLGEQLDSVVQDDSNLSINHLDSVDQDDCSPSDDHLDTALRDDSNPSVDQLEKALHDDSNPSVDPLDSAVCDDSNPSVDQLESTLCTDSSYPVGPSKDQSSSALRDFNPSDSQTGSALCDDASPSDHQQVPELCDYSNPSSDKPESTVPENLRFSISSSKNQPENEFLDSSSSVDHLKTGVDDESNFSIHPSKDQSGPGVNDATRPSGQPVTVVKDDSGPSVRQPRTTVQNDSSQLDDRRRLASFADSNSFDSQLGTALQDDCKASGESNSNSSNSRPGTTLANYSNRSRDTLLDSKSPASPPRTLQGYSNPSNALQATKFQDDSNSSAASSGILQDDSNTSNAHRTIKFQDYSKPSNALRVIKFRDYSNSSAASPRTELQVDSNPSNIQLRTVFQKGSNLSDGISVQDDSSSSDSPPGTVSQGSKQSDKQSETASQKDSTRSNDQPGTDLNDKSKPSGSQKGISLHNYSSQSDSQPKTAPHYSSPSGSTVTALQEKPLSSDAQQRPVLCDSRQSDFLPGNALHNHSNQSDNPPGIVSSIKSSLLRESSKDHPESALPYNSSHPSSPENNGPDTVSPVNLSLGSDSPGDQPEASVREDSGTQVLDQNSNPSSPVYIVERTVDSNPVPVPLSENERNSNAIPSGESPNKDNCFHFVEIKGTPVTVFADPLPIDDPFNSHDIKPSQAELAAEALQCKESDIQKEHTSKIGDEGEIFTDHSNVQDIHTNNSTDIQIPTSTDSDIQEIPTDKESDVQLMPNEDSLSSDNDTTHFFEENTVYVCDEPVKAVCHVCETTVNSSQYKSHLFFGHLQCGHCNRRLVGCDMLQEMKDPKKSICKKSDSQKHSFKDWTLDPIEFLSYYIRKELVIKRFCASLRGPPTVSEIVDEIDCYVSKLSSLATVSPWKTAIAKCHKYVRERKAGAKSKNPKKTIVSVGYPGAKGKYTIRPFFMTGGHSTEISKTVGLPVKQSTEISKTVGLPVKHSQEISKTVGLPVKHSTEISKTVGLPVKQSSTKENSTIKPTVVSSESPISSQETVESVEHPSSHNALDQPAVAPAGQLKTTVLEKVTQPTEVVVVEELALAVASTSKCNSVPEETSGSNFSAKETSQSGKDKSRPGGTFLLKYLGAGLAKRGKYKKASAKTGDDTAKKQSNLIKVPHLKNTFVKAPSDGNYLVVYYPSQPCPETCPNCYCRFDPSKITVNCTTSVITNKCVDCPLTMFIIQDPPHESTQTVKFQNKRKTSPYKFSGPESKRSRKK